MPNGTKIQYPQGKRSSQPVYLWVQDRDVDFQLKGKEYCVWISVAGFDGNAFGQSYLTAIFVDSHIRCSGLGMPMPTKFVWEFDFSDL